MDKQSCASNVRSDQAKKNTGQNEGSQVAETTGPLYEELQSDSILKHHGLVELNENVAYGPIAK